jgi:hypothetical protein
MLPGVYRENGKPLRLKSCVLEYKVASGSPSGSPKTVLSADASEPGETSGIIIDNVSSQGAGTELITDIYFMNCESGGTGDTCAQYSDDCASA